jgi:hypothetical protein
MKAIAASYKIPAPPNDKGDTVDANGNRLTRPAPWPIISRRRLPNDRPRAPPTTARCRPICPSS